MAVESTPAFIRIEGDVCRAYNEAAFRYFLGIERKRADRSVRPLLLILVRLRKNPALPDEAACPVFPKIFSALDECVREVDLVGWYREGAIVGAVLIPSGPAAESVRDRLSARVFRALRQRLAPDEMARVDVRVVELGSRSRM